MFPTIRQKAESAPARFGAVDVAKLLAAAAVVWIHVISCDASEELLPLCRFAVPFFTCAAVYFLLQKISFQNIPVRDYCVQRAQRLYLPFLWWSGVYLAARLLKHAVTGSGSPIVFSPAMLLNGTAHHLWFLPFICLASLGTILAVKCFGRPREGRELWWVITLTGAGVLLMLTPCPVIIETQEFPLSYFIDHAWDLMPAIFFGAALFWLLRIYHPGSWARGFALALAVLSIAWEFVDGVNSIAPHLAGVSLLFFTATQVNRAWMKSLWPWAQLVFVIYLVHVLFVEALQTVSFRFGGEKCFSADLSIWALSLVISGIIAHALSRFPRLAWAFPR